MAATLLWAVGSSQAGLKPHASVPSTAIVELRQYTLQPGKRDVLIELFDREFLETQEAVGMTVIGQFRDLDNPDRFVWLRGFPDMATRAAGLNAFYGGPSWSAHRAAANATMIDADNVLLLEPASSAAAISLDWPRPETPSTEGDGHLVVATIYYPQLEDIHQFAGFFAKSVRPV
ncbi:MAG: NIPSNAP family protein, partial [Acidobacteria bacterium]